ncbi:superfamily II helicase [Bradyrhizobium barranii subsp. barranii]|uniref:DUF2197 domain-containing protein n=1 Tax=Bradyrhizobium barranii subsp. barranii TaxID=2823807 RepID=A0A939MEE6_9BRAD|nr:hypothetical protein [Bradyrhizobium barranii]UEM11905.1 hypothetical protein J4G43_046940 [Bradyrhizobium barranii subsp. barranii]
MNTGVIATKVCKACRQEKPLRDFYLQVRPGLRDATMTVCKECHRERVKRATAERKKVPPRQRAEP